MITWLVGAIMLAGPGAQQSLAGEYLCTTHERAVIASQHRVGSGPPKAFVDKSPATRFKMRITPSRDQKKPYQLGEIAYDGEDRDDAEWQDENSVLHSQYFGDGSEFVAAEGPAFLSFYSTNPDRRAGEFAFYHAGYEIAGGEDTQLVIRWGRCKRLD